MHGICYAYTHNILVIYLAYTMYIQCISNRNFLYIQFKLFDIHGICMVYVMHITSIYLLYDNNNSAGPCTLTHPVLAPGSHHLPAWTYGSWILHTCDVTWKRMVAADFFLVWLYIHVIYILYSYYIHCIYMACSSYMPSSTISGIY
jgi:hypothetical protein